MGILLSNLESEDRSKMETLFRIEMLGRLCVRQGSREIRRFRTQKTAALLAYLAFYPQRSHPRDVLIEIFWPGSVLEAARTNLSVALNALRRQLEAPGIPQGAILIADRSQVRLNPLAFTTDVEAFDSAMHQAETESETERRISLQIDAIDLYAGDLLPGFYEDWILAERDRLRDIYLSALRQVVKGFAETHEYERAIAYAHRMVQADPLRETAYYNLMRLYLAVGRPEDALFQYQTLENLLQKELQISPSAPLRDFAARLHATVPSQRQTLNSRAAESRLSEPTPQVRHTLPEMRRPVSRIPLQFTRYFGQEALLQHLIEQLTPSYPHPSSRLITLTGLGGTGKTRLSIEVARQVKETFSGGIWFVALAELYDPLRLGEVIRDVLELPRQPNATALEQVITYLNALEQPTLLILDNFEQITAGGAPTVWTLLNRVASLHCLVTSRQPLSLPGEREIPVRPLPTPALEPAGFPTSLLTTHLLTYPSIALFVERAQAARPEFQITPRNAGAIAAICTRLEGIPLAIELAAARARALTPLQIEERLSERFELLASRRSDKGERHRSLWAAIEWSYHLLPPGLQRLFARLSVFRGGWSLEAAEAICAEPMALDYLSQLRGHSLLFAEESFTSMRFRMLETLREFAQEQCTPEEREEMQRRHADYFHQWVMGAQRAEGDKAVWLERFEMESDNLRAVLTWSLRKGNALEIGLQTAGALGSFWRMRGHFAEGRRWYDALLERAGDAPVAGVEESLYGAGALAARQGDFPSAIALLERCLATASQHNDERIMALAYNELGGVAFSQGEYAKARPHYEKCLALARAQGKADHMATALGNLANIAFTDRDYSTARALQEESLALRRERKDRSGEAISLHNLANLARAEKRLSEARAYYLESLAIKRELADPYSISISLRGIAEVAKDQEDYAAAAEYLRESLTLARDLNARMHLVNILSLMIALVRALGELEVAARMYGALETVRKEMDSLLDARDQHAYDRDQLELREALGTAVYKAAHTEGKKLSLEQALTCLEEALAADKSGKIT